MLTSGSARWNHPIFDVFSSPIRRHTGLTPKKLRAIECDNGVRNLESPCA